MKLNPYKLRSLIKNKGFTVEEFGSKLDITREGVYDILRRPYLKPDLAEKIRKVLGAQLRDFIEPDDLGDSKENISQEMPPGNIIYVPLYAYGGFLQGYASKVFMDTLERFSLPGITGEHYAFEVDGMSMYDMAAPGDFAIARPEEKLEWMMKGKPYVLQTIDGLLIKIFDRIKEERAHFHSYNKEYDGVDLPLKSIKRVYYVSRILKKI